MSFTATVENDTIKLPPGVHLPNGTKVTVEPEPEKRTEGDETQSLYESLKPFIGCINTGLGDLADNHDHYLYGTPKRAK